MQLSYGTMGEDGAVAPAWRSERVVTPALVVRESACSSFQQRAASSASAPSEWRSRCSARRLRVYSMSTCTRTIDGRTQRRLKQEGTAHDRIENGHRVRVLVRGKPGYGYGYEADQVREEGELGGRELVVALARVDA